jgi:hypothetical protein
MRRSAPWTLLVASLLMVAALLLPPPTSSGSAAQNPEQKTPEKVAEPAKETPKSDVATFELRVLADKMRDAEGVEKAMASDGLKTPPQGYRWVPLDEKAGVTPSDDVIVRDGPTEAGKTTKMLLVKIDRQNVTETDLDRIFTAKDDKNQPALGIHFTRSGSRRFDRLCRDHLPEKEGGERHRLAFIVDGVVRTAPLIHSARRDSAVVAGLRPEEIESLVVRLTRSSVDAKAHDDGLTQFHDSKFGLYVHWGVYALLGKGESVMVADKMSGDDYKKLAAKFNPDRFDAEAWSKSAKDSGAKSMFITVKDQDGFCMFDSRVTDFDMVDTALYAKDPLKPLTDACRKNGIKPYFSYSLTDWHHQDQSAPTPSAESVGSESKGERAGEGVEKSYIRFYQDQIRELCTSYGEIGGIWFQGDVPDRSRASTRRARRQRPQRRPRPARRLAHHRAGFRQRQIAKFTRRPDRERSVHRGGGLAQRLARL